MLFFESFLLGSYNEFQLITLIIELIDKEALEQMLNMT